jgi:predicted PurR-regulated permease PerM
VSILEHLLAAITILALTFFLLLDGRQQGGRLLTRMEPDIAARLRRTATRIAGVVKYKNAVRVHPAVAIVAILVGGQLAGILGALLAIPTAATIGVLIDEALLWRRETTVPDTAGSSASGAQPEPAAD